MIKKLMTAAALLVMAGAASAATLYTTGVLDFNKTTKGSYLGKIGAAVPVTVLKKQGNLSYVRISGWTLAEYPSMIFAEPGVRIEYGSFDEESAVKTNPKAGEKVVQENKWVKATAEGWVQSAKLTNNLNKLWQQGKARHAEACSMCHAAPKADHFTANQWASVLPAKGGRTGHTRAGANAVMFKYLQAHAKK